MSYLITGVVCLTIGIAGGIFLVGYIGCRVKEVREYLIKKLSACDNECEDCK